MSSEYTLCTRHLLSEAVTDADVLLYTALSCQAVKYLKAITPRYSYIVHFQQYFLIAFCTLKIFVRTRFRGNTEELKGERAVSCSDSNAFWSRLKQHILIKPSRLLVGGTTLSREASSGRLSDFHTFIYNNYPSHVCGQRYSRAICLTRDMGAEIY